MKGNELIQTEKDLVCTIADKISQGNEIGKKLWERFSRDFLPKTSLILEHIADLNLPPIKPELI